MRGLPQDVTSIVNHCLLNSPVPTIDAERDKLNKQGIEDEHRLVNLQRGQAQGKHGLNGGQPY